MIPMDVSSIRRCCLAPLTSHTVALQLRRWKDSRSSIRVQAPHRASRSPLDLRRAASPVADNRRRSHFFAGTILRREDADPEFTSTTVAVCRWHTACRTRGQNFGDVRITTAQIRHLTRLGSEVIAKSQQTQRELQDVLRKPSARGRAVSPSRDPKIFKKRPRRTR